MCCLLVLNPVTSTPQRIRQPEPRGSREWRAREDSAQKKKREMVDRKKKEKGWHTSQGI